MENNIKVFIISNSPKDSLKSVTSIFDGVSSSGKTSSTINVVTEQKSDIYDTDYYTLYNLLLSVSDTDYFIFCKDAVVSSSTSKNTLDVIEKTILLNKDSNRFDLFYLAKWVDRCDQYTNFNTINDTGMKLVDTISPNGVLCIMFSPEGRKKFLEIYNIDTNPILTQTNKNKESLGHYLHNRIGLKTNIDSQLPNLRQKFYAITTTPSLLNFDITKRLNDNELIKTVECRDVPTIEIKQNSSNNMSFFWFIIIIIGIILIIFLFYKYSESPSLDNTKIIISTKND